MKIIYKFMASVDKAACKACLEAYNERGVSDGTMKLSPLKKCLVALKLNNYATTLESSIWAKHQDAAKKIPIDKILTVVIPDLAKYEATKDKSKPKDPESILNEILSKLAQGKPEDKQGKSAPVVDRLTDTSKYTGTHKERFDESGKGKGIEGRENVADTSGYVTGYKNKDTYDKTHE